MKTPTANKILKKTLIDFIVAGKTTDDNRVEAIESAMIEFAKLHVKAALNAAAENANMDNEYYESMQEGQRGEIDKQSILTAYSETLIK